MGTDDQFQKIVDASYNFMNQTPDRVPMTDWFETLTPDLKGFRARPVVGGIFMKWLTEEHPASSIAVGEANVSVPSSETDFLSALWQWILSLISGDGIFLQ